MRKHAIAFFAVALALAVIVPRIAESQADYIIGQQKAPVCRASGLTPNLFYNVTDGHWHCTASPSSFQGATAGTVGANQSVIVDANKAIDTIGIKNSLILGGTGVAGAAVSDQYLTKEVTGLVDNTFTDVFTVTVPNAAHAAVIPIVLMSRLGAGGAVGADECVGTAYGQIVVERVSGAATVATAVALSNTGSSCSSGATTIATAYQISSITGAVGVTQTFTIQVRVTKGGGSSAAHKVDAQVDVLNANASGITIS